MDRVHAWKYAPRTWSWITTAARARADLHKRSRAALTIQLPDCTSAAGSAVTSPRPAFLSSIAPAISRDIRSSASRPAPRCAGRRAFVHDLGDGGRRDGSRLGDRGD